MGQALCIQCSSEQSYNEIIYDLFLIKSIQSSRYVQPQNRQVALERLKNQNMYFNNTFTQGILYGKNFGFYQGQINTDRFAHGQGRLIFTNQNQYQGTFQNGKFHGKGKLIDNKNNIHFQGHWQNGQPKHGVLQRQNIKIELSKIKIKEGGKISAKLNIKNSIEYEGDLIQKVLDKRIYLVFQGKGRMNFPDGAQYNGQWYDSKMEGSGKYIWKNGNRYTGNYKNGLRNGEGEMFWKDKNEIYKGNWVNGEPSPSSNIRIGRDIDRSINDSV